MGNRGFTDTVKLAAITENLKKNHGNICCEVCGIKLLSITDCHFDHIFPYAKGGKSSLENCQILCINCNLKKTDKELQNFILEEKAKQFFAGKTDTFFDQKISIDHSEDYNDEMTKETFDQFIKSFIDKKGSIHKIDFSRDGNRLPSIHYVRKYYGDLNNLKKAFGIEDLTYNWNRKTIKECLEGFIAENGDILQKDLKKENRLPSLPCILRYYPEYKSFTDIKRDMLCLPVREKWNAEKAIQAGKEYVKKYGKITETSFRSENNLPTTKVIYNYFGSISAYQQAVGSEVIYKHDYISKEEIERAVNKYFGNGKRIIDTRQSFSQTFSYSLSTIYKRYGSFSSFCKENHITVLKSKKAKYTKQEVEDAIAKWVKTGKEIPAEKELSKLGLPSTSVIQKYYDDWKEPFVFYRTVYEKFNK